MSEQTRLVHGLEPHEALPHGAVVLALQVTAPVGLDDQGALTALEKLPALRPPSYTLLENQYFARQCLLSQLLQVDVLCIF